MSGDSLEAAGTQDLARILAWPEPELPWRPEELAAVLRHQLAAPVKFDLPAAAECAGAGDIATIGDLLRHRNPPVSWLVALKAFAKANAMHPTGGIPREVAQVLYYGAILSAWAYCRQQISSLHPDLLRKSVTEMISASWLDDSTRSCLAEGLARLAESGGGT